MNDVVRVENFEKTYRKVRAVNGVDLSIRKGEIHGLIGPDGSGKSTILKAIAGVLGFDGGGVRVFDTEVNSEATAERIKGRIGFMPQGLGQNLYADLSVEENIDFFARLRLVPKSELDTRKTRLLDMTHLTAFRDRPMKHLSGGMKQKLGLVCSLIHQPELVILDEPTTGVDPVSRRDFWVILSQLLKEYGITAIVSTAYMDEASRFHSVSLMFGGKLLAHGTPEEIEALVPGVIVTVKASPQAEALAAMKLRFPNVQPVGLHLRAFVRNANAEQAGEMVRECLSRLEIEECHTSTPELEDVFIALLDGSEDLQDAGPRARSKTTTPSGASSGEAGAAMPAAGTGGQGLEGAGPALGKEEGARAGKPDAAISAHNLVQQFGPFRAVDNLSFRVAPGEIFGLLGANGAGKTTAIKMLTGILVPSSGEGRVAGADMRRAAQTIKSRVGYMSQAFSLYEDLTAQENLRLYGGIYGLSGAALSKRIDEVVDLADLKGQVGASTQALPMGVRQRLALACALLHRPAVLFLDEPTSGVDPLGRRRFWDILFELSRVEDVTILVTTHYMSEAEHCDHLVLMYAGKSVADATPAEMKAALRKEAGGLLELNADQPLRALELLEQNGFGDAAIFGNAIHLLTHDLNGTIDRIRTLLDANDLELNEAREIPLSMEDVFVHRIMALEDAQTEGTAA